MDLIIPIPIRFLITPIRLNTTHVNHANSSNVALLHSLNPGGVHLQHSSGGGVKGPIGVMAWIKEVVSIHEGNNLHEDGPSSTLLRMGRIATGL